MRIAPIAFDLSTVTTSFSTHRFLIPNFLALHSATVTRRTRFLNSTSPKEVLSHATYPTWQTSLLGGWRTILGLIWRDIGRYLTVKLDFINSPKHFHVLFCPIENMITLILLYSVSIITHVTISAVWYKRKCLDYSGVIEGRLKFSQEICLSEKLWARLIRGILSRWST